MCPSYCQFDIRIRLHFVVTDCWYKLAFINCFGPHVCKNIGNSRSKLGASHGCFLVINGETSEQHSLQFLVIYNLSQPKTKRYTMFCSFVRYIIPKHVIESLWVTLHSLLFILQIFLVRLMYNMRLHAFTDC